MIETLKTIAILLSIFGTGTAIVVGFMNRAKLTAIMGNDIKHVENDIKDIKNWMHDKSKKIDDIENTVIAIKSKCELRHKNGG